MKKPLRLTLVTAFAALALVAAACGSSDDQPALAPATQDVGTQDPASLPPNPNPEPDATPAVGGTCLEGEPDCNDTPDPGREPQDLPNGGPDPAPIPIPEPPVAPGGGSAGFLVGGGLTVSDALATDATGIIAVKGFLFVDDGGARLCESLAESFPPQCGGSSIPVTGYDEVLSVPLTTAQGVSWTDDVVSFLGEIVDGTLIVDPMVAQ